MQKIRHWFYQDLEQTNSTNDSVVDFLAEVKAPCIVSAVKQNQGRGRLGRTWEGKEGNLFVSFAYEINLNQLTQYALLSGLAVLETIRFFAPSLDAKVKWPNDVFIKNRKISGILFEKGPENYWIMGIGVNIAHTPTIKNPMYEVTNLREHNVNVDRLQFLEKLVEIFDLLKQKLEKDGFENIRQTWLDNAYNRGKKIKIKQNDAISEGIFETLDTDGSLILNTKDGLKKILAGDLF